MANSTKYLEDSEILGNKRTQNLEDQELQECLQAARGDGEIDLLIKNAQILDLINGNIETNSIAIKGRVIVGIGNEFEESRCKRVYDAQGLFAVPGFIDGHLHIESSLMHPFEFEKITLPLGTTSAICDPHEITNVLGEKGFEWFLRCSEKMHLNLFVQVSSCVPAIEGLETSGAIFRSAQMKKYKSHPNVLGLAEMMNYPGVIAGDQEVLNKIKMFRDLNLDGHCPLLTGKKLDAYLVAGIQNCHETIKKEEGLEKLKKGMALIIREGSVAKNLSTLAPLVTEFNSPQCLLCTDDRNPFEILEEGHINYLVRLLIKKIGLPPHVAYRLSSYSAAKHFGLKRLGLIAPGKMADIILLKNLEEVEIKDVFIAGKKVEDLKLENGIKKKFTDSKPPLGNSIQREKTTARDFSLNFKKGFYHLIEIVHHEIITKHLKTYFDGKKFDLDDINKIVVLERYGNNLKPSLALVRGFSLKEGAIASSVAHDAHNLMAIGDNDQDISLAINFLIESGGGFVAVKKREILQSINLPIAGLMSTDSALEIATQLTKMKEAQQKLGISLHEPFLQMAFIALPVIPALKITDRGLVDVSRFKFIDLYAGEEK